MKPTVCQPLPPALAPYPPASGPLVIEQVGQAFEVSGPGAADVAALIEAGEVLQSWHPRCWRRLPTDPLKSAEGAALLVGHAWEIPAALVDAYPRDEQWPAQSFTEADGVEHIGLDQIRF